MKLILTRPKVGNKDQTNPCLMFPERSIAFREVFRQWLCYNDIWVGEKDFSLDFNYVYNFYDLELFEILGNGDPRKHFQKAIDFFKKEGYTIKVDHTWRWEKVNSSEGCINNEKYIDGIRIWIYAKKEKE